MPYDEGDHAYATRRRLRTLRRGLDAVAVEDGDLVIFRLPPGVTAKRDIIRELRRTTLKAYCFFRTCCCIC